MTLSSTDSKSAARRSHSDPEYHKYESRTKDDDDMSVLLQATTERKLWTKIDVRVIPVLCVLYLLAFLDRVNIGNANVFGLSDELGLGKDGTKYNNALVIFFVPYVLLEIPSNVLLKRFTPRLWLSACMFLFGLTTMLQGFVTSYGGLLAARFFLGVFETGMFPGCFYLLGMWYPRHKAQKRFSFFFSSTTLAGAFGGLLAAAIGKMDGIRGYLGWRWIFIVEGLLTCLVAILFFFIIPNFPEQAHWLTSEERAYVASELRKDQGQSAIERKITAKDIFGVLRDIRVLVGGLAYFGLIVPAYSYAYFAPGIIKTYGYSTIMTQLYSVPPWAVAFVFSMVMAYLSDRLRHRFAFTMIGTLIGVAGLSILIAVTDNRSLQYAALFLVTMGTYSVMPIVVCWYNCNLGGHHRRSVGSAWQIGFGNIGGIIAVFAFLQRDSPRFLPGYSICLAFIVLAIVSCIAYFFIVWTANKRRARSAVDVGLTQHEKTELGDLSPEYRYQL